MKGEVDKVTEAELRLSGICVKCQKRPVHEFKTAKKQICFTCYSEEVVADLRETVDDLTREITKRGKVPWWKKLWKQIK